MSTGDSGSLPLSGEQAELRSTARRFVKKEVAPAMGGLYDRAARPWHGRRRNGGTVRASAEPLIAGAVRGQC